MRSRTLARHLCILCLVGLGPAFLGTASLVAAAPHLADAATSLQSTGSRLIIEIAKKRKRKSRASAGVTEPEAPVFQPGPDDRLIVTDKAQLLIQPLTPARSYSSGQSVFLSLSVARRKGSRAKTASIALHGDVTGIKVLETEGVTAKSKDGRTLVTIPLAAGSRTFAVELKVVSPGAAVGIAQSRVSQLHVALGTDAENAAIAEAMLAFPLEDCATAYHEALTRLYDRQQAKLDSAVKFASTEDEGLPGAWLFPPRKVSKAELSEQTAVRPPPRLECRWAIDTVSFSTKKRERHCKKWELIEVSSTPEGPQPPVVDEARAQAINKRASLFVESRAAARDFGKSGKLEWISRRIVTDLKGYMQQPAHPALCAGVEIMTGYFVDNAVTLRKELTAADEALLEARGIARSRLSALGMVLGTPPEPAETASISLVSAANAATLVESASASELIGEATRMLVGEPQSAVLLAEPRAMSRLELLRNALAARLDQDATARRVISDALTALEATAYLEAAAGRYSAVGDAIFGSISAINEAHGETCSCRP